MAIPVIAIPDQGKILARPRFEPIYDTEGWHDGAAIGAASNAATQTLYKNSTAFQTTALGLTKQKKRDVNLDAVSGLTVGQSFQWYALALTFQSMDQSQATTAAVWWDQLRKIREMSAVTFFFTQRQPYFTVQAWQIPSRINNPVFTTINNISVQGPACEQERANTYDVTLGGEPVEFGQLEAWSLDVDAGPLIETSVGSGTNITPTLDCYIRAVMTGIFLRGIQS